MRVVLASLAGLLVTGLVVLGGTTAAHACSCGPNPPRQQVAEAAAVFSGELTSIEPARVDDIGLYDYAFRFDVDAVYRGTVGPTAEVISSLGGTSCGLDAEVGQRWLVIANRHPPHEQELSTGYCTETQVLTASVPAFVGEGRPPDGSIAAPHDRTVDTRSIALLVAAVGLAAIAGVTGILAVGRRRSALT